MAGVRLGSLLTALTVEGFTGVEDQLITSMHYDSRYVEPGGLFVAIRGLAADGHDYMEQAIDRGAVAVVGERIPAAVAGVATVKVPNSRRALASLAAAFYGHPSRRLVVIGITGTNGKTTTAYLVEAILQAAGYNVGVIGTINYRHNDRTFHNPVTTPESLDLMRILAEMAGNGVTHAVLEVSSHALDLDRVASCEFDVAVFTNLTQDHLDYHGDMERYWQAKKRLCLECLVAGSKQNRAAAVINRDDPRGESLLAEVSVPCIAFGLSEGSAIRGLGMETTIGGISGTVATPNGSFPVRASLVGRHNAYNILSATGVGVALGIPPAVIKQGIEALQGVPGRLEAVRSATGVSVFVDYAHTPDALENVLRALRGLTTGRLIAIFGCGGDRDRKKRPLMGEAVARLSDLAILTSDNPRSERPEGIIADIEAGVALTTRKRYAPDRLVRGFDQPGYAVEADRRLAIDLGLRAARPGDTVLIAGKGHETYQIIGSQSLPFDDRLEAGKALERLSLTRRRDG